MKTFRFSLIALLVFSLLPCDQIPAPAARAAQPAAATAPAEAQGTPYAPIGVNISSIVDWTSDFPFVDIFKTSRTWLPQCQEWSNPGCTSGWDTGEYAFIDLDENGWVRSLPAPEENRMFDRVSTVMLLGDARAGTGGTYLVLYDGEGTLEYGLGAEKDAAASATGREVISYTPENGLFLLTITQTDPNHTGNYIRNIRVVRPADEFNSELFNPQFLARLDRFKAVRYMDWMETNNSTQGVWANRPKPDDARYACYEPVCKGAPLEIMIALANQTQTEPWFTLPHQATDEYITQFAALVRDQLDPGLQVYVEYSNEVWNGMFAQNGWVNQQAAAEWPVIPDGSSEFDRLINWHAKRTAEMCEIWDNVWAGQADRLTCVAGGWAAVPYINEQILSCPYWDEAPCADHGIDALAIAPYFGGYIGGPEHEGAVQAWTQQADGGLAMLFTEISTGGLLSGEWTPTDGALQEAIRWMQDNKQTADRYGVGLLAYEGGQHLAGVGSAQNNEAITTLFTNANRDERMYAVYRQYLNAWKEAGGGLFMAFSLCGGYGRYGSWGALEYINQPDTPKYRALIDFIDANPCWWPGCVHLAGSSKAASAETLRTGDTLTYTIVIRASEAITQAITMTDTLPAALAYVPGSLQASAGSADDSQAPALSWSGTLSETQTVTVTYAAQATASGAQVVVNEAHIAAAGYPPVTRQAVVYLNMLRVFLPFVRR
ncbi:MAG: cellulose-binding protein [Chloroflexota bacterium]